jgi:predicted dinucleotide-binding enzyme
MAQETAAARRDAARLRAENAQLLKRVSRLERSPRHPQKEHTMKIAIVGAGSVGGTLARRFAALGHNIAISNSRGAERLADLAAETGAVPMPVGEAMQGADVVILAIPKRSMPQLPTGIIDAAPRRVVVIDPSNYAPRQRDGYIAEIENGTIESRWTEARIGHPVVKAFNNITARHLSALARPAGSPERIALPVAGDDPVAKIIAMSVVDEFGFDPVNAGDLDNSWRQQPGTPVYTTDLDKDGVREALAAASPERRPEWRAA